MSKKELIKEIELWLKDFEKANSMNLIDFDEKTFEDSAYLLFREVLKILKNRYVKKTKKISSS